VTNLVEAPTALLGNFEASHLALPSEVLVGVMKKHQRYFPVKDAQGKLMAHFITIRNGGSEHLNIVAHGNEEVIAARFADAAFFMREDSKHSIEDFLPRLNSLIFHPKLGSMLDRSLRIAGLAKKLAAMLKLNAQQTADALEAARLCKADLSTKMVVEMTSLQGVIGRYYALKSGKNSQVAQAIEAHYYPRFAGDASPETEPAMVVALADRADALAGLFAAGMAPTGTKDPFGLRRAAIGLVQILIDRNIHLDLRELLGAAASQLPVTADQKLLGACMDFISGRFENMLLEAGNRHDVVRAVLAEQSHNPAAAVAAIKELAAWTSRMDWASIHPAYSRCVRITRDLPAVYTLHPEKLAEPQEKALYAALEEARTALGSGSSLDALLSRFTGIIPAINAFFDTILVMDKDQAVRENRLALLQSIAGLAKGKADFSKLEGF
jgi:glycyl-tRNA synthetase